MDKIDFAKQVKEQLIAHNIENASSEEEKRAVVAAALEDVKKNNSTEDLKHVFDPNRELTQRELEQVAGGSIGGDIGGWIGKELGTAAGNIVEDGISALVKLLF